MAALGIVEPEVAAQSRASRGHALVGVKMHLLVLQTPPQPFHELAPEVVVGRLNRLMTGWANYFHLGQVSPAHVAIDRHATRRLRRWLCRKHKVRAGRYVRFPDKHLWEDLGLTRLALRTVSFPWAKA